MRPWLIRVLTRLLRWLDPPPPLVPPPPDAVRETARALVAWASTFDPGTSGEYRRHVVLAKLVKAHPTVSGRQLSILIEHVLAE